jgi:uncharacterized protein YjbI with pentapeptide repeats
MFAGLPGLAALIALLFTYQQVNATNVQLRIAQQGQITDRYNAAITNLGSRSIEVRLGGIYALQRLMQDSPRDQPTVVAVLCAFVRDRSASTPARVRVEPTDIQAAVTVVLTRDTAHDGHNTVVDFSGTDLSAATFPLNANLTGANLTGVYLNGTVLAGANFTGAHLNGVNFTGANLIGADLVYADLTRANLTGADLASANLSGADLIYADLASAHLEAADFSGAYLFHANLTGADLYHAIHTRDIAAIGAHAPPVYPNFSGADLTGARWSKNLRTPKGWVRDPGSGRLRPANPGT